MYHAAFKDEHRPLKRSNSELTYLKHMYIMCKTRASDARRSLAKLSINHSIVRTHRRRIWVDHVKTRKTYGGSSVTAQTKDCIPPFAETSPSASGWWSPCLPRLDRPPPPRRRWPIREEATRGGPITRGGQSHEEDQSHEQDQSQEEGPTYKRRTNHERWISTRTAPPTIRVQDKTNKWVNLKRPIFGHMRYSSYSHGIVDWHPLGAYNPSLY